MTELRAFEYDACGNLLHREDVTTQNGGSASDESSYTYNGYNQLMSAVNTYGDTCEYTYDAEGLRNSKASADEMTRYICESGNIVLETDGTGKVTAKNVWGMRLLMREKNGQTYSYFFNGHGDITALTEEHGYVLEDYDYDPYGNELTETSKASAGYSWQAAQVTYYDNPFRYCGEYLDLETNNYYLRARYYDPTTGRFLSEDTYPGKAIDPLSLNLYIYCKNNPVMYTDPSGHVGIYNGNIYMDEGDTQADLKLIQYKIEYANASTDVQRNAIAQKASLLRQQNAGGYRVLSTQSLSDFYIPDVTSNLHQFVADRTEKFAEHAGNLSWFRAHVDYGAEVDLKENSMFARPDYCYFVAYAGKVYRGDMPGNFAYGYLGKSALFPNIVLYVGAGIAQQTNKSAPKDWKWIFTSYGDAPGDRAFVDMGINYYYSVWGPSGYIPAPQPGPGPEY
ncbi:MAG: hypothetical protein KBI01_10045 [Oscillospiraceae bacterium]|nr:hypothetical protein [Oscillospiraceae bacterium]